MHTCDDPASCALASLSRETRPRLPDGWRPGQRVAWIEGDVPRTGEVWSAAPGRAVWVVPDESMPADTLWGLPSVQLP